jgi:alpha-galactosidase
MELKIKAVGAYFAPEGIVADTPNNPKYAEYKVEESENTYNLYVTAEYEPAAISVRIPVSAGVCDTVFMNGYQSATDSRELDVMDKMTGVDMVSAYAKHFYAEMFGGDYSIVRYKNLPGVVHGFSYCYFKSGNQIKLFASLDESTGYTVFKYDANTATLKVSKDIEGVKCLNGYKAISLFYAEGSEDEVFDKWFASLGKSENMPAPALVGYSTKKLGKINEDVIDHKLNAVKAYFPVKPNMFIIDGEYCKNGDWLAPCAKKFPEGLRYISDEIKAQDMMTGLCISPFTASADSSVIAEHKDWVLRHSDGKAVKTKKNLFVLDAENEEVRAYVRECIHTILYMWGFDLIKLDNLYVAGLVPSRGKSRGEKMCSAMSFLRECCGGKLMYADHAPLMPAFGIADYCAISCDVIANNIPAVYSERYYREGVSVRNASADIVFRRGLNNRAFLNAPCTVSLDDKEFFLDGRLNAAEQNVLTNLMGLFTSVLIMSDTAATYDQKKKRRFKKMCALSTDAENVKVTKTDDGFLVSYKMDEKSYVVKFK